ncbi:type II toxin-antitoxin system HigB family toxin [Candidatus Saccharibacteria bacterium]|nr:type II toxin-antitoxin system HigB family toxin [Candidatus Saccharibacteria bacterium]
MTLHNKEELASFKRKHPDAVGQINAWEAEVEAADWQSSHRVKERYSHASIINRREIVFNISGNKYRIWVLISYLNRIVKVIKAGTHREYDKWDIGKYSHE